MAVILMISVAWIVINAMSSIAIAVVDYLRTSYEFLGGALTGCWNAYSYRCIEANQTACAFYNSCKAQAIDEFGSWRLDFINYIIGVFGEWKLLAIVFLIGFILFTIRR